MPFTPKLVIVSSLLAALVSGCGVVKINTGRDGGQPNQCAAVSPAETSTRRERMKLVVAAGRGRFTASAQAFKDSDNDGAFEVAAGQPLLVAKCNRDDITLYTALGRVVRMPASQSSARLTDTPARWNLDDERSAHETSTESVLANATKEMIAEAAAVDILAARNHCLEAKVVACQRAERAVEKGPPVADLASARTSACSTAGDKVFATCFAAHEQRFPAVVSALRTLEQQADAAQKDALRPKFR